MVWSSLFSQIHAEQFFNQEVPSNAMQALQMFHDALQDPVKENKASQAIAELIFTGKYKSITYGFRSKSATPKEAKIIRKILKEAGAIAGQNNDIAQQISRYPESKTEKTPQVHTQKCLTIFKVASLRSYLQHPYIPREVENIANTGVHNYQQDPLKTQRKNALATHAQKGGRRKNWIQQTFGQTETKLMASLKKIAPPQTWRIRDINTLYNQLTRENKQQLYPTLFTIVYGVSANYIPHAPTGPGSIGQGASQFDYRESFGAYRNPVSSYIEDPTQGPQMSVEAATAALHRAAAEEANKLLHALHKILLDPSMITPHLGTTKAQNYYTQGYLRPYFLWDDELVQVYEKMATEIDDLEILPQWVIWESTGAQQLQVFTAAPSYQGMLSYRTPLGEKLCELLVVAQYEAIAKIAVIRSLLSPGPTIPLHLTLLGQGAFNNPPSVITKALKRMHKIVQGHNIHVYVHIYDPETAPLDAVWSSGIEFEEMSRKDFLRPKKLSSQAKK